MRDVLERRSARGLAVVLALAVVAVLAGCGGSGGGSTSGGSGSAKKFTIGFVSPGADSPFWIDTTAGAKTAGKAMTDASVVVGTGPGGANFAGMIPVIQNMVTRGVDAIVVPGIAQLVPALKRVDTAGIPIIFYADGIPGSPLPKSTVNTDSVKGGELAGNYIKQGLGGKGTLAIIEYPKGEYPFIDDRVKGVEDALKGTQIKITHLDAGCDAEAPAVAATQNVLTRIPNLSAVFGECGTPTLGAIQAIKQAKIDPSKILVVGYDGDAAEIQAILDGTQDATVAQYPVRMGAMAVQTAQKVLQGKTVPAAVDPGTLLITKDNAASELHRKR